MAACADDTTGTGNTSPNQTTPLQTPRRRISVQQYRPRAQDFLTNLDPINSQIFSIMSGGSIEPKICEQIRKYINYNLKIFYEYIFKENKRFMATAMTSQSEKLNQTIFEVQQAYSDVIGNMTILANNFLNETNTKCANISSVQTLGAINKKVGELRAIQLSTATQLATLPQKYENEMQSNYVPVENIIGPA